MITSVFFIIGSIVYTACPTIMPYHHEALGVEWGALSNNLKVLLISSVKATAAGFFTTGIACLFLIKFTWRQRWSNYCLLILNVFWLLPLIIIGIYIANATGAHTPWPIAATLLLIALTGFFFSVSESK
jgi:hypothetical protein